MDEVFLAGDMPDRDAHFTAIYPHLRRAVRVRSAAAVRAGISVSNRPDLEQEALISVWLALSDYDRSLASLRTFVERIIHNRTVSFWRANRRWQTIDALETQQLATEAGTDALEVQADVQRVIASIDPPCRSLALMLMEETPSEASRQLGLARSTVYERIRNLRTAFTRAGLGLRR